MPSPGLTSNVWAKASRLRSTWLHRNSAGEWGSTASICRANWGRVAVRQARAHEKKKRWAPVISSDDRGCLRGESLLGQRGHPRLPCDCHAAQVADVLTDGQGAVDVGERTLGAVFAVVGHGLVTLSGQEDRGREDVVLSDEGVGALLEGGPVLLGPPIDRLPSPSYRDPWSSKP